MESRLGCLDCAPDKTLQFLSKQFNICPLEDNRVVEAHLHSLLGTILNKQTSQLPVTRNLAFQPKVERFFIYSRAADA